MLVGRQRPGDRPLHPQLLPRGWHRGGSRGGGAGPRPVPQDARPQQVTGGWRVRRRPTRGEERDVPQAERRRDGEADRRLRP